MPLGLGDGNGPETYRMALSDSCFDFLRATADAAEELAVAVHRYSAPDYPIPYGIEIDALRRMFGGETGTV
jgi:hypothetical protein